MGFNSESKASIVQKDQLMEALKYWDSSQFRKLQTKLTKTANSIYEDALGGRVKPFLSSDDIDVLRAVEKINFPKSITVQLI